MKVLLKEIRVPSILEIIRASILESENRTVGIVDINGEVSVRFFRKNLRAAEVIGSRYSVLGLRCSDTVCVVGEGRLFFLRSRVLPLPLLRLICF